MQASVSSFFQAMFSQSLYANLGVGQAELAETTNAKNGEWKMYG